MAKKPSTAMPLDAKSTPAERESANRTHHEELIGHVLDNAVALGHGHAVGSGSTGKMVPSDAHLQNGAYIPRAVLQPDGGNRADDPSQDDYAVADRGDD